jgi:hypothetical protein
MHDFCISIQYHNMLVPLGALEGPQKPSSCLSEGVLCTILQMDFAEFPFYALG